jgi:hypothetical protein
VFIGARLYSPSLSQRPAHFAVIQAVQSLAQPLIATGKRLITPPCAHQRQTAQPAVTEPPAGAAVG